MSAKPIDFFAINRRTFLVGLGSATVMLSACGSLSGKVDVDPVSSEISRIIQDKLELVSDAKLLTSTDSKLVQPLQVVIDQNLVHIDALNNFAPSTPSASPTDGKGRTVDLPALSTRCEVFSANNINLACSVSDAELSRRLALIAASEMQHHVLLSGFVA